MQAKLTKAMRVGSLVLIPHADWDLLTKRMHRDFLAKVFGLSVHAVSAYRARQRIPYAQFYRLGQAYLERFQEQVESGKRDALKLLKRLKVIQDYEFTDLGFTWKLNPPPEEVKRSYTGKNLADYRVEDLLQELCRRGFVVRVEPS